MINETGNSIAAILISKSDIIFYNYFSTLEQNPNNTEFKESCIETTSDVLMLVSSQIITIWILSTLYIASYAYRSAR